MLYSPQAFLLFLIDPESLHKGALIAGHPPLDSNPNALVDPIPRIKIGGILRGQMRMLTLPLPTEVILPLLQAARQHALILQLHGRRQIVVPLVDLVLAVAVERPPVVVLLHEDVLGGLGVVRQVGAQPFVLEKAFLVG